MYRKAGGIKKETWEFRQRTNEIRDAGSELTVSPKPIFELLERPVASSCLLVNPHITLRGHTEVHRELVGR